nr:MAG TPA: hypothetical protein [Caudoviricetes sp.]
MINYTVMDGKRLEIVQNVVGNRTRTVFQSFCVGTGAIAPVPLVVGLVAKPRVSVGLGVELANHAVTRGDVALPGFQVTHDAVHLAALTGANALRQVPAVGGVRRPVAGKLGGVPGFPARFLNPVGVSLVGVCHVSSLSVCWCVHCLRIVPRLGIEPSFVAIDAGMLRLELTNHAFDSCQVGLPSFARTVGPVKCSQCFRLKRVRNETTATIPWRQPTLLNRRERKTHRAAPILPSAHVYGTVLRRRKPALGKHYFT